MVPFFETSLMFPEYIFCLELGQGAPANNQSHLNWISQKKNIFHYALLKKKLKHFFVIVKYCRGLIHLQNKNNFFGVTPVDKFINSNKP